MPEPTIKYSAGTRYNRLIDRRCASLDLEAAFKQITISRDIVKQVCKDCNAVPTSTSDEQIPELVPDKLLQQLHLPLKTSSDKEGDREVEAIAHQENITG